ncbi:MAG: hypothetical protein QNJ97_04760 [Myxococcota bacterium]|nr:hypothetical protein [Myxococcota bacterium]
MQGYQTITRIHSVLAFVLLLPLLSITVTFANTGDYNDASGESDSDSDSDGDIDIDGDSDGDDEGDDNGADYNDNDGSANDNEGDGTDKCCWTIACTPPESKPLFLPSTPHLKTSSQNIFIFRRE